MQKQTKLEDYEAFKQIVESYNIMAKSFRQKNHKTKSKGLMQTVLSPISENKKIRGFDN